MRPWFVLAVLLSLALAGCTDNEPTEPEPGTDPSDDAPVDSGDPADPPADPPGDAPPMAITISATGTYPFNPALTPARFEVPSGTMLTVTFTNSDNNPFVGHDVKFSGVDEQTPQISNGESTELVFLVDLAPGEYPFWCTIGNHREQGMEGVMVVT